MSISKWDPFRELEDMSRRLNRVFGASPLQRGGQEEMTYPDWQPLVDISETPETFVITAELPEVKKEDIKITLENGVLTIRGERRFEKEEKGKKYHRVERAYGSFLRSFAVPESVDQEKVRADAKDGVLTVTLAKSAKVLPRTVDVQVH
jgi:HSP20 family protein